MRSDNYVVIQGWMCNELNLKGNELLIYALIYGFSQDGESQFNGSRGYIADTFNITLPTVDKALDNLKSQGLIECHKQANNHCTYTCTCKETLQALVKKLDKPCKETLHNNINSSIDNKDNTLYKYNEKKRGLISVEPFYVEEKPKKKKPDKYHKCHEYILQYTNNIVLQETLDRYLRMLLEKENTTRGTSSPYALYVNQWPSIVNTLDTLANNIDDMVAIVNQSIVNKWNKFVALSNNSGYKKTATIKGTDYEKNVNSDKHTKLDLSGKVY